MREKCDAEIPCTRCVTVSGRARSWKLPCTRQWLNERGEHLLPNVLTSQLEIKNVDDFINNKTFFKWEGSRMKVPLTIGFGQPLVLDAVEVTLIGQDLISMHGFAPGLCAFSMQSPPIVPCWPVDVDAIYTRAKTWMSEVLSTGGSEYPENCFPQPHPSRHRDILALIHQHYETSPNIGIDDSCVVTSALRLSVATYVMGHALTVPQHLVSNLFSELRNPDFRSPIHSDSDDEDDPVCPRAVNKVVKSIILRLTRHLVIKTFAQLHAQLGPKLCPSASFEAAFAASFLLLTALGQIQASLYERAVAGARQNPPDMSFGMDDARREIHKMENELGRYIVYLFLYRYNPKKKTRSGSRSPDRNSSSPTSASGSTVFIGTGSPSTYTYSMTFRERLQAILQREKEEIRAANRELSDGPLEEQLFQESGVANVTRVLAKLCAPLIED